MKKLIVFVAVAILLAGGGAWYWAASSQPGNNFRTAKAERSRLVATIGATGTLQPEEVVDVGAQVAGRIEYLGVDPSDPKKVIQWGSAVHGPVLNDKGEVIKKGTILAQLDKNLYQAQVDTATADLKRAEKDRLQKQAQLNQATADWKRAQDLLPSHGLSQAEYDAFKAGSEIAKANLEVSKAQIEVAKGTLDLAKTNLDYATIRSPVNGVIVDRRINVGQTVVASLSAPSMFLIAKDLSKMEVWATVNEADVGKIRIGQPVKFTVDAYPGDVFKGTVKPQGEYPSRLNASMTQNVVTYTVVVSAENTPSPGFPKGKLIPYLTANLLFTVSEKDDALVVPNAALRWQPAGRQIHPDARAEYAKLKIRKRAEGEPERGFVWVVDGGFVRPIQVQLGASDKINTEVVAVLGGGQLSEGADLVVGEGRTQNGDAGGNPFAPQLFKKPQEKQ